MNAVELFVLSRRLMELAEDALPQGHVATSVRLVVVDVGFHPDSSISEITERTGFPQSHVSASVAKLRDLGILQSEVDPADRRRTLVRLTPSAMERAVSVRTLPIDAVLASALADDDAGEVDELVDALELLARRLTPTALARLRSDVGS